MSHHWIDPNACQSLAVLVETVTAPLLIEHPAAIGLEVDIDASLPIPTDPVQTSELIRTLVTQSLCEMGQGGDLTITACSGSEGIELELADTGNRVEDRHQSIPMVAAVIGASIRWQNCPQGGAAATITFPPQANRGRLAA